MVCGCSFSAISRFNQHKNTSWSELLSNKLGWELQNIARQGCSNGAIRIQIDEVIRQRPDFAIITPTSYDRIEIPNFDRDKINITNFNPFQIVIDLLLRPTDFFNDYDNNSYHKDAGLNNINYGDNNSRMISELIHSLAGNWIHAYRPDKPVPKDVQEALQMYVNYMYDAMWKKQIDEWIIRDGLVQLQAHNIPFLINTGLTLWKNVDEVKLVLSNVISEKYILNDDTKNPSKVHLSHPPDGSTKENPFGTDDPGYHTNYEGQRIIADAFYDIIKERWGL